jgi:hypothetical protein
LDKTLRGKTKDSKKADRKTFTFLGKSKGKGGSGIGTPQKTDTKTLLESSRLVESTKILEREMTRTAVFLNEADQSTVFLLEQNLCSEVNFIVLNAMVQFFKDFQADLLTQQSAFFSKAYQVFILFYYIIFFIC